MSSKFFHRAVLVSWVLVQAFCGIAKSQQAVDPNPSALGAALPPEQRYYILFSSWVSRTSPNLQPPVQLGHDDQPVRRITYREIFQRSAQLTDEESRTLNQIALGCMSKIKPITERRGQLIGALRAKYGSNPSAPPPATAPERQELDRLRPPQDAIVRNAINQLRLAFGEAEFKRLDDYLLSQRINRHPVPPPPDKKPLPVQVGLALFDQHGETSRTRFSAKERFTLQLTMQNKSAQTISVTPYELFAWLQLLSVVEDADTINLLFKLRGDHTSEEQFVSLPPNEVVIVARIEVGFGDIVFKPGAYHFTIHDKVLLNRGPNDSDWLALSLSEPLTFQIVP